jgi:hypothetical protein
MENMEFVYVVYVILLAIIAICTMMIVRSIVMIELCVKTLCDNSITSDVYIKGIYKTLLEIRYKTPIDSNADLK